MYTVKNEISFLIAVNILTQYGKKKGEGLMMAYNMPELAA
jgi:hypothetical protein